MQHELFPQSGLSITPPPGRSEPRLWVKRLVIWEKPDHILREVPMRPGLNIIWSPDPGNQEGLPIGHGSGKTTFCRMLRYCLGEDSFAPDGQRTAIWSHFPEGSVGAEIVLDQEVWVVMRSLGHRRRDIVIKNGTFADAFQAQEPTGIEPLHNAILQAIIGNAASLMPHPIGENGAWQAALAWATRDQECRFGHHLEWRDPDSNSHSPVRGRSVGDRLAIVRALLGALTKEEIAEQKLTEDVESILSENRSFLGKLDWQIERMRKQLSEALGTGGTAAGVDLDAAALRTIAQQKLEKVLNLPAANSAMDLASVRREYNAARDELNNLQNELSKNAIAIEEKGKLVLAMKAELPDAQALVVAGENPVCPICRVPIDTVLAKGCNLSSVTCDLETLKANIQAKREAIQKEEDEIARIRGQEPTIKYNTAAARQKLAPIENRIVALEKALTERSSIIRAAERIVDDAERYEQLLGERARIEKLINEKDVELTKRKETLAAHRDAASETVNNLSSRFDMIMRELIHENIKGEVKLDGHGLTLKVLLGGERSSTAINSLKIVAFDIAALTLSMEGRTFMPSFLLHDSPREGDLGASIYHRLFKLIEQLEACAQQPLFQYIVTTTTEPPTEYQRDPWLSLRIHGAPADQRLLKTDL